jgi:3-aminobutanoyl-CoA transaminase
VLPKLYEDVLEVHYNDLQGLEDTLKQHGSETAMIIMTPVGHPNAHEVEMPKPGYLEGVKQLAEKYGVVLCFDEIRTGFRISLGGAQKYFGVTPHMSVFGKAMANGYEISMVAGRKDIMDVLVSKAFVSSTYFNNTLAMVASLKTIELLERDNMLDVIAKRGQAFCNKVRRHVKKSGLAVTFSGEPWMPYITFDKDETGAYKKNRVRFYTELIRRKVFLQPYHHGYVCYRHSARDLNYAADMIAEALEETRKAA